MSTKITQEKYKEMIHTMQGQASGGYWSYDFAKKLIDVVLAAQNAEVEKPSPLPEISPAPWKQNPDNRFTFLDTHDVYLGTVALDLTTGEANKALILAAPDLRDDAYKLYLDYEEGRVLNFDDLKQALLKAGMREDL